MVEDIRDSDPWRQLSKPVGEQPISALRADATHPWEFFWGIDSEGRKLLVLRFKESSASRFRLPRARGLKVLYTQSGEPGTQLLVIALVDSTLLDVFWRLCVDVIDGTRGADSELEAVSIAVRRTWRWHNLLRGGSDNRLSPQQQIGLIGELETLKNLVIPGAGALAAVESWKGPEDGPKDFDLGSVALESKAGSDGSKGRVNISSLEQLTTGGFSNVFLSVTHVRRATDGSSGKTIIEIAQFIYENLRDTSPSVADEFELKLEAAGLYQSHSYDEFVWEVGETTVFAVEAAFPRIEKPDVHEAIDRVSYSITVSDCSEFAVDHDDVRAAIQRSAS